MLRLRSSMLALVLSPLTLLGCKKNEEASTEAIELIPADLQGLYGRNPDDAPGMRVTATGLEFNEMTLTIHEGKMEGDTVRIERATVGWEKLEPRTCSGTISRQGDRLLMSLYEVGGAREECDSILDAEWFAWKQLDELPAMVQGRYGVVSVEPKGMRLEVDWLDERMNAETIFELPGTNDVRAELLISDAKVVWEEDGKSHEVQCTGTLTLEDGWLKTDFWVPKHLIPTPGTEAADDPEVQAKIADNERTCKGWIGRAVKWEVSMDALPKAPIAKGEVSLAITPETVVLASPAMRCEQELWRTQTVESRAGWGGTGQLGGERMTLGKAEPTAVSDACKLNIRIWCERQDGADIESLDIEAPPAEHIAECMKQTEHELCPAAITVQAISDLRYKFQVEPPTFNQIACVDTTGDFTIQK